MYDYFSNDRKPLFALGGVWEIGMSEDQREGVYLDFLMRKHSSNTSRDIKAVGGTSVPTFDKWCLILTPPFEGIEGYQSDGCIALSVL